MTAGIGDAVAVAVATAVTELMYVDKATASDDVAGVVTAAVSEGMAGVTAAVQVTAPDTTNNSAAASIIQEAEPSPIPWPERTVTV